MVGATNSLNVAASDLPVLVSLTVRDPEPGAVSDTGTPAAAFEADAAT